jgi:ADP-ribosylglycohydrolase
MKVTIVTHNHPEGLKGALATTEAIYHSIQGINKSDLRSMITKTYGYDLSRSVDEIRVNNPRNETCQKTVPEAITCALESISFEDAIRNAVSIGGDSDTIAAITGSIAEAMYGVPDIFMAKALGILPKDIKDVITQFEKRLSIKCITPG